MASAPPRPLTLGVIETIGFTAAMTALDAASKLAQVRVVQAELNDLMGLVIKLAGDRGSLESAIAAAAVEAKRRHATACGRLLDAVAEQTWAVLSSPAEFNPLLMQNVVLTPGKAPIMPAHAPALGFIETQGFTAVFQAIDAACKAADVEVVAKEKLGGGYITVVIRGDVAAVQTAIDTGSKRVDALGKLIASHVIARPSDAVLSLLPNSS
jgi:microcompartment protein CcmL/EutN